MPEVGLSLGSNQGDRLANLRAAVESLQAVPGFSLAGKSPVYETEPVDVPPEFSGSKFLNTVVVAAFGGGLDAIAEAIRSVEDAAGRVRGAAKNMPRTLDVDVIYFGDTVAASPLQVPHPRWAARRFVVQPLCDLRPGLILPGGRRTVSEVLLSLPDVPRVVLFARTW